MEIGKASKRHVPRRPKGPKADWTAWSLHLVFGFIVGAVIGFPLAVKMQTMHILPPGNLIQATLGFSFVLAAGTSHYGDRLWERRSLLDMPEWPRSKSSAVISLILGTVGTAIVAVTLLSSLRKTSYEWGEISFADLPLLVLALILITLCVHGFRTDTLHGIGFYVHRYESPFSYWFLLGSQVLTATGLLIAVFK